MHSTESSHSHSVTALIERLKQGDSLAEHQLWIRFFTKLVRTADAKLRNQPKRMGDGEDVAFLAFSNFLDGVEKNRFPRLDDRDDLWQILLMLTSRRANDHIKKERAVKRGHDQLVGESALSPNHARDDQLPTLDLASGDQPTPEFAIQCAEEIERLFQLLDDEQLVRIATAKLNGFSNTEIAEQEGIGLRTVENRMSLIRQIWKNGLADE